MLIVHFISSIANFWPIQLRGPAEKGVYANGLYCWANSPKNLSGEKTSGFGNISESRATAYTNRVAVLPAGIIILPSVLNTTKHEFKVLYEILI